VVDEKQHARHLKPLGHGSHYPRKFRRQEQQKESQYLPKKYLNVPVFQIFYQGFAVAFYSGQYDITF